MLNRDRKKKRVKEGKKGGEEAGWTSDRLTADSRIIDINRDCIVTSNGGGGGETIRRFNYPRSFAGGRERRARTISPRPELLGISEFFRRLGINQDTFLNGARTSALIKSPLTKLISEIRSGEWVTTTTLVATPRVVSLLEKLARLCGRACCFCFSQSRRMAKNESPVRSARA